jgi:hypothetical protein
MACRKNDKRLKSGMGGRCHASGKRRLSVDHHAKGRKGTPPSRACIIQLPCANYAVDEYLTDNDHLVYPAEGCHCPRLYLSRQGAAAAWCKRHAILHCILREPCITRCMIISREPSRSINYCFAQIADRGFAGS